MNKVYVPEFKDKISDIVTTICKSQSPSALKELRESTFDLLTSCVPPNIIVRLILKKFIEKEFNNETFREIFYWIAFYMRRINNGSKAFIHLEALYARLMYVVYHFNATKK